MQSESLPSFYQPESVVQISGAEGASLGHLPRYQIKNDTFVMYAFRKLNKCPQLLFVYDRASLTCPEGWWQHHRSQDFREIRHWKASDCTLPRHGAFHPSCYWDSFNAQQFSKWEVSYTKSGTAHYCTKVWASSMFDHILILFLMS